MRQQQPSELAERIGKLFQAYHETLERRKELNTTALTPVYKSSPLNSALDDFAQWIQSQVVVATQRR